MESASYTQEKNEELFRRLYTSHASTVYQRLYSSCMDKLLVRDILKEVFKYAYDCMQHVDVPDNAAQWLNQLADEALQKRLREAEHANTESQIGQPPVHFPECVQELSAEVGGGADDATEGDADNAQRAIASVRERGLREHSVPAKREKGYAALASLLTILLIISIWYVAGLLMQRGMLPRIDLGYTWFSTNVFKLF